MIRFVALALLFTAAAAVRSQPAPTYADIAPLFQQRCVMCHAGESPAAGLRLDTLEGLMKGGTKGAVVKIGAPEASELVRRIKGISQPRMPMTGPPFLADDEVTRIERWIAGGLLPGTAGKTLPPAAAASHRPRPGEQVTFVHVAPIFATRCAKCHTESGIMGPAPEGFRLTSYASALTRSDRVRVVAGNVGASELIRRIQGVSRPCMPLDGPPYLSAEEAQLIVDWIAQGARDASGTPAPVPAGSSVRLHGTLDAGGRLDGLDLVSGPRTHDRNAAAGAYVEVRGTLDKSGRVIVDRLRPR